MANARSAAGIGYLAAILMALGYVLYAKLLFANEIEPNLTTWGLWAIGGVIEFQALAGTVQQQRKESSLGAFRPETLSILICSVFVVVVFVSILVLSWTGVLTAGFAPIGTLDLLVIPIDLWVIWALLKEKNPTKANMLMQIDIALTYAPIISTTQNNPASERFEIWVIWTVAYFLTAAGLWKSSASNRRRGRIFEIVHPIFNGLLCLAVAMFASKILDYIPSLR